MVTTEDLGHILHEHPAFQGLTEDQHAIVAGCAANVVFRAGEYICREQQPADRFYLIRVGRIAVEVHLPQRSPIIVATLQAGDILGWSWLIAPYRTNFDARALDMTRLISLDAACLRGKMDADPILGYAIYKCMAPVVVSRLNAAMRQLIDVYGHPGDKGAGL